MRVYMLDRAGTIRGEKGARPNRAIDKHIAIGECYNKPIRKLWKSKQPT